MTLYNVRFGLVGSNEVKEYHILTYNMDRAELAALNFLQVKDNITDPVQYTAVSILAIDEE